MLRRCAPQVTPCVRQSGPVVVSSGWRPVGSPCTGFSRGPALCLARPRESPLRRGYSAHRAEAVRARAA